MAVCVLVSHFMFMYKHTVYIHHMKKEAACYLSGGGPVCAVELHNSRGL